MGFVTRMAWREGRAGFRRLLLYAGAVVLGVGALVAIHSFRADVERALDAEAQTLLGADVRVATTQVFPDSLNAVLDSLETAGVRVARGATVVSMVLAEGSEGVRLMQVRALESDYPFYGEVRTTPAGLWSTLHEEPIALVDPAVLIQLDTRVGDTLQIGERRYRLAGTVEGLPTQPGMQTAVGPRVFISRPELERTGLVTFGSLVRYQAYIELPDREERDRFYEENEAVVGASQVNYQTANGQAQELTVALDFLSRYLGLIGIAALLLGGIGVASAIHVYVKERLVGVAVLRCIGAEQNRVFRAYLLQAAVLGGVGSLLGAVLGVTVQHLLPLALADVLPVQVDPRIAPVPLAVGALVGAWVSFVFALDPLLSIRGVPPLLALRHDVEPQPASRGLRAGIWVLLVASVLGITLIEAPSALEGLAFAAALTAVGGALWGVAVVLVKVLRRWFPSGAAYPVRQGLGNLFRPGNQTVAVTFALGFGAFIIGTVGLLQSNLVREFELGDTSERANLLLFDVQPSQAADVLSLLEAEGATGIVEVPLVPSRLVAINGVVRDSLNVLLEEDRPEGWALRREYRHSYRADASDTEDLVAGEWWDGPVAEGELGQISLEADLAESLGVGLGDRITWSFGGMEVETRITSLRVVDWAQFAPNFFAVFQPGAIDDAPQTRMAFGRIEGERERNLFQRDLVRAHPNVSVLDLSRLQETLDGVLARVNQAVRFLGGFCTVAGLFVLIGALGTTRYQRMREGALLKTLGARRVVILRILLTEYAALGILAVSTGLILAVGAGWALLHWVFETSFTLPVVQLAVLGLAVTTLTVVVGLLGSRGVLRNRPLQVLREVGG